jgi:hypothetical protein
MAIKQVRLPDGTVVEFDEWLQWPAFSTFEASSDASLDIRLFSYVVGGRLPQAGAVVTGPRDATITDTNWVARSRVNHDEAYIWYSMTYEHFALENTTPFDNDPPDLQATRPILRGTNLRTLQKDVLLELFVGAGISKPQASAPLSYYGQGIGAVAYGSGDSLLIAQGGATQLELNYGTAGCISPRNQRTWMLPIYVQPDRVAFCKATSPGGVMAGLNQDYSLRVYLDGLKRRPIA